MRSNHRKATIAVAAAVAAGSVALAAPVTAKGLYDAYNAHKVDEIWGLVRDEALKAQGTRAP